jgi:hypothetical protein
MNVIERTIAQITDFRPSISLNGGSTVANIISRITPKNDNNN